MRDLFRAFEREGVRQLLIGGQAAILYGAAFYTQDLDFWVEPSPQNIRRFIRALAGLDARVHKLTPPLSRRWVRLGHGFHFVLTDEAGRPAYLDAMGIPPRVGPFASAERRAATMKSPWGRLAVVAIEDLVELKKTNRPGDYEVISRLARLRLSQSNSPTPPLVRWACENSFRVEDFEAIVKDFFTLLPPKSASRNPALNALVAAARKGCAPTPAQDSRAARFLDHRLIQHLAAGRRYWTPRIAELRKLRSAGGLIPEGTFVKDLIS